MSKTSSQQNVARVLANLAVVGLPIILAYLLAAMDIRIDLSWLKPTRAFTEDGAALVAWSDLTSSRWRLADRDRMIGYMMVNDERPRDGAPVRTFILMPEAGHFLHPAPRDPARMVEVRLRRPMAFGYRQMVWVTGLLTATAASPHEPSYTMWDATFVPARNREVTHWFVP